MPPKLKTLGSSALVGMTVPPADHCGVSIALVNANRARLGPKRPCCLEQALTCRCGREQRAVLRQQLALDKPNRLAELGHLGFGNDGAGLGGRQEIHSNACAAFIAGWGIRSGCR
jgi:hypothetical protein